MAEVGLQIERGGFSSDALSRAEAMMAAASDALAEARAIYRQTLGCAIADHDVDQRRAVFRVGCLMPPARVTDCAHFPLADLDAAVMQVEGTVQMVYLAHGWPGGPLKAMSNQFAGPGTAAELRAIADYLDTINWAALSGAA